MLHRIQKIISVQPYSVVCEWTNGEIRSIDLEKKLKEWATPDHSIYKNLLDENTFMSVDLDTESKTLKWQGLLRVKNTSGNIIKADLDLDPEVLYEISTPFKNQDKSTKT